MRLVVVSDTHNQFNRVEVPDGDVLLHCGDATNMGTAPEITKFNAHLSRLPHKLKIFTPGNHDWLFQKDPTFARSLLPEATVLIDEEAVVDGVRFWGSPWTPAFCNWAFNLDRIEDLEAVWAKIPEGTDVLLTHGPPYKILDAVPRGYVGGWESGEDLQHGEHVGCKALGDRVLKVRPKLHAFGHIHASYGELSFEGTRYVNASTCDEQYMPINKPVVLDL